MHIIIIMTETTTNSHVSVSLPNISHIKKLEEIEDYTEWSQDVQATLINGGWWKYVCPPPDFRAHVTKPEILVESMRSPWTLQGLHRD